MFGLHIKKAVFGPCNDILADLLYLLLKNKQKQEDKVTLSCTFVSPPHDFVFIPDWNQTLIHLQIYCLVHSLSWPLYFSLFSICCMPTSQFSNNIIKMWFVVTVISSTWGRCLGKKEFLNLNLELDLKIFVKFVWLALHQFEHLEMLPFPVFYHN